MGIKNSHSGLLFSHVRAEICSGLAVCIGMTVIHFLIFSYYYPCIFKKKRYDNRELCKSF